MTKSNCIFRRERQRDKGNKLHTLGQKDLWRQCYVTCLQRWLFMQVNVGYTCTFR